VAGAAQSRAQQPNAWAGVGLAPCGIIHRPAAVCAPGDARQISQRKPHPRGAVCIDFHLRLSSAGEDHAPNPGPARTMRPTLDRRGPFRPTRDPGGPLRPSRGTVGARAADLVIVSSSSRGRAVIEQGNVRG
jgi:hypothetical protein